MVWSAWDQALGSPDDVEPLGYFVDVTVAVAANDEEGGSDIVLGYDI